jgi:hypothetical protein
LVGRLLASTTISKLVEPTNLALTLELTNIRSKLILYSSHTTQIFISLQSLFEKFKNNNIGLVGSFTTKNRKLKWTDFRAVYISHIKSRITVPYSCK